MILEQNFQDYTAFRLCSGWIQKAVDVFAQLDPFVFYDPSLKFRNTVSPLGRIILVQLNQARYSCPGNFRIYTKLNSPIYV